MDYFMDRLKEKTSQGGLGLVVVGVLMLVAPVDLVAYAAIAYGGYQIFTKG